MLRKLKLRRKKGFLIKKACMASKGNKIFPRHLLVNVKEAPGIFLITLWWANKLAQMYTCSHTYITFRVRESIISGPKMAQKRFFTEKPFLTGKYIFYDPFRPFQGENVDTLHKFSIKDFSSKCDQTRRKLRFGHIYSKSP